MVAGMPSPEHLWTFVLASVVLIIVPGPTVVFVVSQAIAFGRRAALAGVLGNTLGAIVLVAAVAVGVGALIEASVVMFTVIKLLGAAYLIYLGVQAIRHRKRLAAPAPELPGGRRMFTRGLLVGVSNPKTIVFFGAVLPQFVDPGAGHAPAQMLVLGLVFCLLALSLDSVWGLSAGAARDWLARSPRRLAALGGAGGLMMIGLGAALAVSGRKD